MAKNDIQNIIVNVNFFSDFNITVSTTLKHYHKQVINKKLKSVEGTMKHFPEKLQGHEAFSSIVPWDTKYFLKNL